MMKGQSLFNWIFTVLASLVLLFIIAPLAGMFLKSSFSEVGKTAADPEVQRSVWYHSCHRILGNDHLCCRCGASCLDHGPQGVPAQESGAGHH